MLIQYSQQVTRLDDMYFWLAKQYIQVIDLKWLSNHSSLKVARALTIKEEITEVKQAKSAKGNNK